MPASRRLLWSLVALSLLTAPGLAQHQPDPARSLRQVLDQGDYQRTLPDSSSPSGPSGAEEERSVRRLHRSGDDGSGSIGGSGGLTVGAGSVLGSVLWIVLGVLVALVVAVAVWRARSAPKDVSVPPAPKPEPRASVSTIERGDAADLARELAERGEFAEAIHVLLQRSLDALRARGALDVGPSSTSREVLRAPSLRGPVKASLTTLVVAVEQSLFARRPAVRADYEVCVREFEALSAAAAGGRA